MKSEWVASIVMNLLFLASCGTPDKTAETTAAQATPEQMKEMQRQADRIIEQQMAKMQQREASTFPCSLFSQQDIETLAGNPLDKGSYAFNNVSENDREYRSESCGWSAARGDGNEINLSVSLPKHFNSARVECAPSIGAQRTAGIGDQAWWDYQSFGMGTLRVCSAKAMLEVKVTVKNKEKAAARKIAQTVAEKVLASL